MTTLAELMVKVGADTGGFDKGIKGVQTSTQKMSGSLKGAFGKVSKGFGSLAKGTAKVAGAVGVFKLVDGAINMVSNSIGGAIQRVDTLNQFPKVLQQMGYSAEDAEKSTAKLKSGIDGLPTTLNEITGTTQRMVNVFQDVDKATDSAVAINNAFLASGASSDEASRGVDQYVKMLSTGKVEMDSWNTLQETMPYALQQTAEAFGFTGRSAQQDLYKALQEGHITMDDFNDKVIELSEGTGGFAEVALTASGGIGTSFKNIQTAITNGVANIITAFDDWFDSKGFGGIAGVLDNVKAKVNEVFSFIVEAIPKVLSKFEEMYNTVKNSTAFQKFKDIVVNTFNTIVEVVTTIFGKVVEIVQSYLASVQSAWENRGQGIMTRAMEIFSTIYETISTILSDAVVFIQEKLQVVKDFFDENGEQIYTAIMNIWTAILAIFQFIMPALQLIVETVWGAIKGIIGGALDIIMGLVKIFAGLFTGDFKKMWEGTKQLFSGQIKAVLSIFKAGFFGMIVKVVVDLVKNVVGKVKELWNKVTSGFNDGKNKVTGVMNIVKTFLQTVWNSIKSVITGVVNAIKSVITSVFNAIKSVVSTIFNGIKTIATTVWNAIKTVITGVVNGVKSTVSSVFNGIKSTVSSIFNGIKSTATTVWNGIKTAITNPIESAKETVLGIIDSIKGAFSKMKIKIPKPKLPKVSISKGEGLFGIPYPKFSVSWNAKGAIFDGATVLGGGQGVGEAGAEAVLPIQHKRYMRPFASAVASHLDSFTAEKEEPTPQKITVEIPVNLNGTEVARLVEEDVSRLQLDRQKRKNRSI